MDCVPEYVRRIRQRLFENVPRDRDAYHREIERRLGPGLTVLDVGCGKGVLNPFPWREHPGVRLVGLDPDPEAARNPNLHEFHLLRSGESWPCMPGSVDLVICRYVLEHVAEPDAFMQNARLVLRPGGEMIFLTPSKYYPVMVMSALLPHSLHRKILGRTKRSAENDVFETFYRMNSKRALRTYARRNGFEVVKLVQRDFQPADYFDFNTMLFLVNLASYYIAKLFRLDRQFGASLLGAFRRV
jgi:2-polyprenyl-3-methyl-5-hydroxy-6-metoxy-1,4-benzoquinol methylase